MPTNYQPMSSSAISGLEYDPDAQTLVVHFAKGGTYQYDGVPQEEYLAFVKAPSAGQFFNAVIKPAYKYTNIGV